MEEIQGKIDMMGYLRNEVAEFIVSRFNALCEMAEQAGIRIRDADNYDYELRASAFKYEDNTIWYSVS